MIRPLIALAGRLAANLLVSVLSVVAFLLALEGGLRAAQWKPPVYVTFEEYPGSPLYFGPNNKKRWCGYPGAVKEFDNEVVTNSMGYHDTDHTVEKPAGVFRILVIGDSFVEALQVPLEKTFFKVLEANLNRTGDLFGGKKVETIAIGISGAGSSQELLTLIKTGLAYSPDLVISELLIQNDFRDDLLYSAERHKVTRLKPRNHPAEKAKITGTLAAYNRFLLFKDSYVNRWFAFLLIESARNVLLQKNLGRVDRMNLGAYAKPGVKELELDRKVCDKGFAFTAANYVVMDRIVRKAQSRFLAVIVDHPLTYDPAEAKKIMAYFPDLKGKMDFRIPSMRLHKFFLHNRIPFVDLGPAFAEAFQKRRQRTHFLRDGHWNVEGHRLAAETIETYLRNSYRISGPAKTDSRQTR